MAKDFDPKPIVDAMRRSSDDELQALAADLNALRDENDSLRAECQELRTECKQHEEFIEEVSELLPPSYDADEAVEAIILRFLKDMQNLAQIIAKLTADYR
jgi:predicted  nucleic acid-binding Zn-ribbon protein